MLSLIHIWTVIIHMIICQRNQIRSQFFQDPGPLRLRPEGILFPLQRLSPAADAEFMIQKENVRSPGPLQYLGRNAGRKALRIIVMLSLIHI